MSESLGSIFAEARKSKGLSVKDVAESIRVKLEYIQAIESDNFDFNLPAIHKRGFIRLYAEFLRLDVEDIMKKCPISAFETMSSSPKRKDMVSQITKKMQMVNHDDIATTFSDESPEQSEENLPVNRSLDRNLIIKIAGVIATALLLIILSIWGIFSIISRARPGAEDLSNNFQLSEEASIGKKMLLRSTGDVRVMIRDRETKEKIFSGTLSKGSEKIIDYSKPVQVYYDKGELFVIELGNGERLHLEQGRGGIEIK